MIEYHIVANVFVPQNGGTSIKQAFRNSDRTAAIARYNYLKDLLKDKSREKELFQYSRENLQVDGVITGLDGLYGVVSVKILDN